MTLFPPVRLALGSARIYPINDVEPKKACFGAFFVSTYPKACPKRNCFRWRPDRKRIEPRLPDLQHRDDRYICERHVRKPVDRPGRLGRDGIDDRHAEDDCAEDGIAGTGGALVVE